MKYVGHSAAVILSLLMLATPVAVSAQTTQGGGSVPTVVPADHVAGSTGGELIGDFFEDQLSLPADESPFGGSASLCLDIGRQGKVLAPSGQISADVPCTVTAGRPVVFVTAYAECSTAEPPPFFAATAREQRTCALDSLRSDPALVIGAITLSVDGGRPVGVHQRRFLEVSPQRHVVFPENPVFDATPGPADFVGAAWMAQIRGMHIGEHTVECAVTLTINGQTVVSTFGAHFTVVPRS